MTGSQQPSDVRFVVQRGDSSVDADLELIHGLTSRDIIDAVADARSGTSAALSSENAAAPTGTSRARVFVSDAGGSGKWIEAPEVLVDAFPGADNTGATDSSAAVTAALARLESIRSATGANNLGVLRFGPGRWTFGGIAIGNKAVTIRGAGPTATVFVPRSSSEIMIQVGDGTVLTNHGYAFEAFGLEMTVNRSTGVPVMNLTLVKDFHFDRVNLNAGPHPGGWGTFITTHSCYEGTFRRMEFERGSYAVPLDIRVDTVNPASGVIDQADTIKFEHIVSNMPCGVIVRGVSPGQTGGDQHNISFDQYKVVNVLYGTSRAPNFFGSATADIAAGDTVIHVNVNGGVADTGLQANDLVTIGLNDHFEAHKIQSIDTGANTITLLRGTEFAHSLSDSTRYPNGVPIILGGYGASIGNNIQTLSMKHVHDERQPVFVYLGSVSAATFDEVYMGGSTFCHLVGGPSGVKFGAMAMLGTSVNNRVASVPSFRMGSSAPSNVVFDGPFVAVSGAAVTPVVDFPVPGFGVNAWTGWSQPSGTRVRQLKQSCYQTTDNTSVVRISQRQNAGNNGYDTMAKEITSGNAYFVDGVCTKELGDITGKTSAQIDALFGQSPANQPITVSYLCPATLSGNRVHLSRQGGSNKWYVSAALTQIT